MSRSWLLLVLPLLLAGCSERPLPSAPGDARLESGAGPSATVAAIACSQDAACASCHEDVASALAGSTHAFDPPLRIPVGATAPTASRRESGERVHLPDQADKRCAGCHLVVDEQLGERSANLYATSRSDGGPTVCARCHRAQFEQWSLGAHDRLGRTGESLEEFSAEWGSFVCNGCHTTEGFVERFDEDHEDGIEREFSRPVGCVACHDPHDGLAGDHLRARTPRSVLYDVNAAPVFEDRGASQLCVQCHRDRRTVAAVASQIENGSSHFGPHGSPQMELFLGAGCYEIEGYAYDRTHWHNTSGLLHDACAACHMTLATTEHGSNRRHDFAASTTACTHCHGNQDDFDVNGYQTTTAARLQQVLDLLAELGMPADSLGFPGVGTPEMRMAAYAYAFVTEDGSLGVHNPAYTESLLENAIDWLESLGE